MVSEQARTAVKYSARRHLLGARTRTELQRTGIQENEKWYETKVTGNVCCVTLYGGVLVVYGETYSVTVSTPLHTPCSISVGGGLRARGMRDKVNPGWCPLLSILLRYPFTIPEIPNTPA